MRDITVNGKKVVGVKPWTKKQLLKIYWLMSLWVLFFIYLIVANAIWGNLWMTFGESMLFMGGFLISMFLTRKWFRRQERINFKYEGD